MRWAWLAVVLLLFTTNAVAAEEPPRGEPNSLRDNGDLFPRAGRPTVAAGTGVPFFGLAELGLGITNNFTVAAMAGVAQTVEMVGVRPRVRIPTSEHTAILLVAPMVFYPHAPPPNDTGSSSWMLTRPELFIDGAIGERFHLAGGMGLIAAASTKAVGEFIAGRDVEMPAYDASKKAEKGFAGGVWNTVGTRASYTLLRDTHLFTEAALVLRGYKPAEGLGGPPVVIAMGIQHAF